MHAITKKYRSILDKLIFAVSEAVEAEGQLSPQFHVFSETVEPCPSEETGAFDEFPDWPLEADEVQSLFFVYVFGTSSTSSYLQCFEICSVTFNMDRSYQVFTFPERKPRKTKKDTYER